MIFIIPSKSVYQYLFSELLSFIQAVAPIPAHFIFIHPFFFQTMSGSPVPWTVDRETLL